MLILGFDISTSCIGWSLIRKKKGGYDLIDCDYISFGKTKNFYDKVYVFEQFLINFGAKYGSPDVVMVEEPAKLFKNSLSSAHVIILLQRFNAVCCFLINDTFGVEPSLIMPSRSRKLAGIKVPRGSKAKEVVLTNVLARDIIPEEKLVKKRTGKYKDYVYDICDAYVVSLSGLYDVEKE